MWSKGPWVSMCRHGLAGHPTLLVLIRGPTTPFTRGRAVLTGRVRPRTTEDTGIGVVIGSREKAARGTPYQVALPSPLGVRVQSVTCTNARCRRGVVLALAASSALCTGWLVAWAGTTAAHGCAIFVAPRPTGAHCTRRPGSGGRGCRAEMTRRAYAGVFAAGLWACCGSVFSTRRAVTFPRRRVCPRAARLTGDISRAVRNCPGCAWFTLGVHACIR
jgi:hypothetical protein